MLQLRLSFLVLAILHVITVTFRCASQPLILPPPTPHSDTLPPRSPTATATQD